MTPRSRRAALAGLVAIAAVGVALDGQHAPRRESHHRAPKTPTPAAPAPTPPALTRAQVDRQDRVSAAHRRRETRALDQRPLLTVLPLELAGVRIDITGLAGDDRTTLITVDPGSRARRYAQALYRRALNALDDPGTAYAFRWAP